MEEINYVCSLGHQCHCATFLKRNNFKLESYPFDWIVSSPKIILHCINDEFKTFMDKSQYLIVNDTLCNNLFYSDELKLYGSRAMFYHHDPLRSQKDYHYFSRCVQRFKKLLKEDGRKLFVMFDIYYDPNKFEDTKKKWIDFNNEFKTFTKNYTLLIILNIPKWTRNDHKFSDIDGVTFLELYVKSKSDYCKYPDPNDNHYLDKLIKTKYSFNLKKIQGPLDDSKLPNIINNNINNINNLNETKSISCANIKKTPNTKLVKRPNIVHLNKK